ncbi:MAG TPA: RagB/SusD family nutrient uptake outer membrane protein [Gemmatimonadales bacterium]
MMPKKSSPVRVWVVVAAVSLLAGCGGLLDVSDPSRFKDEDLDKALDAVANGAEGEFHGALDNLIYFSALLGDEWQHTGTWADWDDADHGRVRYAQDPADFTMDDLLRARFAAQDAQARFQRVLGSGAASSPLMAQVLAVDGVIDLILAENFCEAPEGQGTAAISDTAMYRQAITKLQNAQAVANASGRRVRGQGDTVDYALVAQAGIARANLFLGNYAEARAAAQAVPTAFTYGAVYTENAQRNDIVFLATAGFNKAGGVREKWWSQVDTVNSMLIDPFTGERDPRVPIRHDPRAVGVDGITPFYSQWKYRSLNSTIEVIGGREMRLIEAEAAWQSGDYATAMAILNALRADVGLSAVPTPGTRDSVFEVLLHERFAENFMEGHRTNDLYRFNLTAAYVARGDFDSPTAGGRSSPDRATKFPLSQTEATYNAQIVDNASVRCSPHL